MELRLLSPPLILLPPPNTGSVRCPPWGLGWGGGSRSIFRILMTPEAKYLGDRTQQFHVDVK